MSTKSTNGSDDRNELGLKMRGKLMGEGHRKSLEKNAQFSPQMARWQVENLFGECYGDETLDLKTRSLCTVSALIALGHSDPQLATHIRGALRIGITKEELGALISQMVWYAGLPSATRAMSILQRELAEQQ
jgi:4-carboxymuconolactone decarboxylase